MLPKDKLNIMIDIDGTVSDDIPNEESHRFINASLIDGAVEKVNKLYSEGHIITLHQGKKIIEMILKLGLKIIIFYFIIC